MENAKNVLTLFGKGTSDNDLDLPYIYWIRKIQKITLNTYIHCRLIQMFQQASIHSSYTSSSKVLETA